MNKTPVPLQQFEFGKILQSAKIIKKLRFFSILPHLCEHGSQQWKGISKDEVQSNEEAIKLKTGIILSRHEAVEKDNRCPVLFCIATDQDKKITKVFLQEEQSSERFVKC